MRNVLLDANLLIGVFDTHDSKAEAHFECLLEEEANLAVTPLIRYEVLCGVKWHKQDDYQFINEQLATFGLFQITSEVAELAENLFRFSQYKNIKVPDKKKYKFDIFHFAAAKYYVLEIETFDGDFEQLERLYADYQQEVAA